jgi:hypothetical protein
MFLWHPLGVVRVMRCHIVLVTPQGVGGPPRCHLGVVRGVGRHKIMSTLSPLLFVKQWCCSVLDSSLVQFILNISIQRCGMQDPSLVLTGPIRAVMVSDHIIFEADLKVKGNIESEDKALSFLAARYTSSNAETYLTKRDYISKLSNLEFTLGYILRSVEATINMRVTDGAWLADFHGKFVVRIDSIKDEQVVLLDSGDTKVHLDGKDILLSRSVVSVDIPGELIISVEVWQGIKEKVNLRKDEKSFTSFEMSSSRGEIDVGFCKIEITIAWSLFGPHP